MVIIGKNLYIAYLSMVVAFESMCFVVMLGVPIAFFMARAKFAGKEFIEAIITLPLVLPPVVAGFALLLLFGKNGPAGSGY